MGKKYNNLITMTAGFKYNAKQPLDDRAVVEYFDDLENLIVYDGIEVYVTEQKKSYKLIDGTWKAVATEDYVNNHSGSGGGSGLDQDAVDARIEQLAVVTNPEPSSQTINGSLDVNEDLSAESLVSKGSFIVINESVPTYEKDICLAFAVDDKVFGSETYQQKAYAISFNKDTQTLRLGEGVIGWGEDGKTLSYFNYNALPEGEYKEDTADQAIATRADGITDGNIPQWDATKNMFIDSGYSADGLDNRIDGVEAQINTLSADIESVDNRVSQLELDAGGGSGDSASDIATLEARMDAAEENINQLGDNKLDKTTYNNDVTAINNALTELSNTKVDNTTYITDLGAIETALADHTKDAQAHLAEDDVESIVNTAIANKIGEGGTVKLNVEWDKINNKPSPLDTPDNIGSIITESNIGDHAVLTNANTQTINGSITITENLKVTGTIDNASITTLAATTDALEAEDIAIRTDLSELANTVSAWDSTLSGIENNIDTAVTTHNESSKAHSNIINPINNKLAAVDTSIAALEAEDATIKNALEGLAETVDKKLDESIYTTDLENINNSLVVLNNKADTANSNIATLQSDKLDKTVHENYVKEHESTHTNINDTIDDITKDINNLKQNKQDLIEDNTYDDYGAADRAKQEAIDEAKKYTDGLAGNYATSAQGKLADTAIQPEAFAQPLSLGSGTKAISVGSLAEGNNWTEGRNIAGLKAFSIKTINIASDTGAFVVKSLPNFPEGATDIRVSAQIKNNYNLIGFIDNILADNEAMIYTIIVKFNSPEIAAAMQAELEAGRTPTALWFPDYPDCGGDLDGGRGAHSEGGDTLATQICAHAEGYYTHALGKYAHAEGKSTEAAFAAHAEGEGTTAYGNNSHAEGKNTSALAQADHAEGEGTTASGGAAHAEGDETQALGNRSHTEGLRTVALGHAAHAEGFSSAVNTDWTTKKCLKAEGEASHAEGKDTYAVGSYSHAEGIITCARGSGAHAEGNSTVAEGNSSHAEGYKVTASGEYAHAEGYNSTATGESAHAEGYETVSLYRSHAEGYRTSAENIGAHAEGDQSKAIGKGAHAEGYKVTANGAYDHAEGNQTIASGGSSHAEGIGTSATSYGAHAEGSNTNANSKFSHAQNELTIAKKQGATATGYTTTANGRYAFTGGIHTSATQPGQFVVGHYNVDNANALFIVGNGEITEQLDENAKFTGYEKTTASNAFTVNKDGTATVAAGPQYSMDVATKKYVDDLIADRLTEVQTTWNAQITAINSEVDEIKTDYATIEYVDAEIDAIGPGQNGAAYYNKEEIDALYLSILDKLGYVSITIKNESDYDINVIVDDKDTLISPANSAVIETTKDTDVVISGTPNRFSVDISSGALVSSGLDDTVTDSLQVKKYNAKASGTVIINPIYNVTVINESNGTVTVDEYVLEPGYDPDGNPLNEATFSVSDGNVDIPTTSIDVIKNGEKLEPELNSTTYLIDSDSTLTIYSKDYIPASITLREDGVDTLELSDSYYLDVTENDYVKKGSTIIITRDLNSTTSDLGGAYWADGVSTELINDSQDKICQIKYTVLTDAKSVTIKNLESI